MADRSLIEWTDATWNPLITGCTKVSPGCKHCYASRIASRLQAMGQPTYTDGFRLTIHQEDERTLRLPLQWKEPRRIFVNSMTDLFHEQVPLSVIGRIWAVMQEADWHWYQLLTKRSERLLALSAQLVWLPHLWMGVSVERADYAFRIAHLRQCGAVVTFLWLEPLLGPLPDLDLAGIDWVIVGGESGPLSRPMHASWVREIRGQCQGAGALFCFKQWGGPNKHRTGRLLDGRTCDEMPRVYAERYARTSSTGKAL